MTSPTLSHPADPMHATMMALLMVTAGCMLAMAAGMGRASRPLVSWTGVTFDLAAVAYAIKLWNIQAGVLPLWLSAPIIAISASTVGWFWLFVMALFEDHIRIRRIMLAPVVLLVIAMMASTYLPAPFAPWFYIVFNLTQICMAVHVLYLVAQGWTGDLVEARRQLRGPFLATVTAYILITRGFEVMNAFGVVPDWYLIANATALCIVCLLGTLVFLESRGELFGAIREPAAVRGAMPERARHAPDTSLLDRAIKADLDRLQALMSTQEIWREEGLTISSLAMKSGLPETQLRRLINDSLGYRNFPSFVNAHRIAAAKARLADPKQARTTVSTIAYDIGFASLGPFNRAFREETGLSPSEWRRKIRSEPASDATDTPGEATARRE
ncbi:MAG: AraC family transcriptional regulator [Hyphomonadaceae bacterium]